MWIWIGIAASLAVAAAAWRRSRMRGGHYDAGVYGMFPAIHRRYAYVAAAFLLYFVLTLALHAVGLAVAGLGVFTVVAILYGASFLRGASEEHE